MGFSIHSFENSTSIGQELQSARRRLAVSLDEMEHRTKIQKKYLMAIEADRWQDLPEPIYTRNFLRSYALCIGKNPDYILSRFKKERGCCDYVDRYKTPLQKVRKSRLVVTSRIVRLIILGLMAIIMFGYLGLQIRSIIQPPDLEIISPADGTTLEVPTIVVVGVSEKDALVFVNSNRVLTSDDGKFETQIMLERGLNVITVKSKKRHSDFAAVYRTVIFDPPVDDQ
jgi:hypothetical protein